MALVGETKYNGTKLSDINATQVLTKKMSVALFNTGENLSSFYPDMVNPFDAFYFPRGDDKNQRVGDYMWLKHLTVKLLIEIPPLKIDSEIGPALIRPRLTDYDVRVIIVKANRKYNKLNDPPIYANELFLNTENGTFGYSNATATTNDYCTQMINKRKWIVKRDMKFKMSNPEMMYTAEDLVTPNLDVATMAAYRPKYASTRRLRFRFPFNMKTHFSTATDRPDDIDTQYLIAVQMTYCNQKFADDMLVPAPQFACSWVGTTSALDS